MPSSAVNAAITAAETTQTIAEARLESAVGARQQLIATSVVRSVEAAQQKLEKLT